MENQQDPQFQSIQSQPAVTQNITPEAPKKSKKWVLLLVIFLIISIASMVGVYAGIFRLPILNQQKLKVLPEQKEKYRRLAQKIILPVNFLGKLSGRLNGE